MVTVDVGIMEINDSSYDSCSNASCNNLKLKYQNDKLVCFNCYHKNLNIYKCYLHIKSSVYELILKLENWEAMVICSNPLLKNVFIIIK